MKKVGYWSSNEEPNLPDPKESIDTSWDIGERLKVIRYLRDGQKYQINTNIEPCQLRCRSLLGMEVNDLTDGHWLWPEHLAHYVECHAVKPPHDFLEHIRNNLYKVPPPITYKLPTTRYSIKP